MPNIPRLSETHELTEDVVFAHADGVPLRYDHYRPRKVTGPVPAVVFVHGGAWMNGDPSQAAGNALHFVRRGIATIAISYRLAPAHRFPAPLDDVRAAVGWVGDHGASYGLDAGRVFGWGDSAGGHLALLAALTGAKVHGVVAWFPVTDLAGLPSDVADAGGVPDPGPESREALLLGAPAAAVPELAREASPVAHASAAAPPVLLMHGAADNLVPPAQSIRLAGALRAAGATVELELVPGATHFWKGASDVPGIVRRSVGFLRTVTPGGAAR